MFTVSLLTQIILSLGSVSKGELYSAMAGMETLLNTQKDIIDTLQLYIIESRKKMKELEKLKEDYDRLLNISSVKFQDFITNPINAFILMKKLSIDWNKTRKNFYYLRNDSTEKNDVIYPDAEDLSGAAKALLRVQQTYGLDTRVLSEGKIEGATSDLTLSADDCFELSRQALHSEYIGYAPSWLEEARQKSKTQNEDVGFAVTEYLKSSYEYEEQDSLMLFTNSLLQFSYMMSPYFSSDQSLDTAESNTLLSTSQITPFDEIKYRRLCKSRKGAKPLAPSVYEPQLHCQLIQSHPWLVLQPIKEEELWKEPKISLFYDVISDREIEIMKTLALPILQRAEVAEYTGHMGHRVSDTRVTKVAWINEDDHLLIPKLYHRIESITGLSSVTVEPFQMANYGLGGHFHLHMDVLPESEKYFSPEMGNRIATWLIYMSEVNGGGATVFPRLNLTVWPKKGAALFWHNIKSNGVGNVLTLHGACPVVYGSKWVTNVWFHERGQEFRLKCGLYPESSLKPIEDFSIS